MKSNLYSSKPSVFAPLPLTRSTQTSKPRQSAIMRILCLLFFSVGVAFGGLENYNVGTWNLQGSSASTESKWNVSVRQLITGDNPVDVLMVQEAGVLPHTATMTERAVQPVGVGIPIHEYLWNLGTRSRPSSAYIYYSRVDVGANRVNLAIVSRQRADEVIVIPPPTTLSRPIIGIRIGNDAFFSIHALASGGNDAGAIVQAIHEHFRNRPGINWMIAGDFNREPNDLLRILDASVRANVNVVAPDTFTQTGGRRVLDYALTGNSNTTVVYTPPPLAAVLMFGNVRSHLASDHFPVNFRRF